MKYFFNYKGVKNIENLQRLFRSHKGLVWFFIVVCVIASMWFWRSYRIRTRLKRHYRKISHQL
jgi:hypothetical protein